MNEFRDCILGTGLIHLPVQGELFSWHNCSEGDRSLWKRLDRLLVNDAWLRLWSNSHYQCLNARTSDHSPLVLRGDTDKHTISMFRFDNYLTMSLEFIPLVQNVGGTELRKKKGDLSVNVKLAAEFLATVQQLLQIDKHNSLLLRLEKCCKLVFFKATKLEQAPGPDGYSSGFYKAAWPVIGEEMIKAILEFFTTALETSARQADQPIQNAFVPGRSIGDNILLAQELFAGYNRQGLPMRCALKVDLRKAYDTVEWDFLSAVLQLFGFPGTFIGWVEQCVTTPMFSVCINGNPHGFFKGSRGLRQGDPMSPFLFVLIMEVLQLMLLQLIDQNEGFSFHWRCKELGLFQLCFADDLLLFCKADVASVWVLDMGWTSSPNCPGYMPIHKRVSLFSPVQHRMSGNNYLQHYISRRVTFPSGTLDFLF
ncbi:hypothetical protein Sango_3100200 [Sesamum angolense]|uniref:Reverse transcriptase domain-containing protein n=1 Tax=Sesamum angolense TaxID=2727404 RepID=A0AAE1T8U8_9LAMI|nr:hypothetical protein Sango_3100200 [Sesamum angolense]